MNDYILFMHDDATEQISEAEWLTYFAEMRESGAFQGGSSIGVGEVMRKAGSPGPQTDHLTGYIRVRAESMAAARLFVENNPVFRSGGSVEVRELPRD